MRRATLLIFGPITAVAIWAGYAGVFNVPVESEAVITQRGEVVRVLGPGLQWRTPIVERAYVYPTRLETYHLLAERALVARCPVELAAVTNVSDVVAFHRGGAVNEFPDAARRAAVEAAGGVRAVPENAEDATREAVREALEGQMPDGLNLVRVHVNEEPGCLPEALQTATREVALPAIATVGTVGAEQSQPFEMRILTTDRVEVDLRGVIATWDVTDADKLQTCFGRDPARVGTRIVPLAESAIRARAEEVPAGSIDQFAVGLTDEIRRLAADLEESCGVLLQAVDFGGAEAVRRVLAE